MKIKTSARCGCFRFEFKVFGLVQKHGAAFKPGVHRGLHPGYRNKLQSHFKFFCKEFVDLSVTAFPDIADSTVLFKKILVAKMDT